MFPTYPFGLLLGRVRGDIRDVSPLQGLLILLGFPELQADCYPLLPPHLMRKRMGALRAGKSGCHPV